jgi:hypothetical protein
VWQIVQALDLMRLQIAVDQIINRLEAQASDMHGLSQYPTLGDKENSLIAVPDDSYCGPLQVTSSAGNGL